VPDDRKNQLFTALWPELEKQIQAIPAEAPTAKHMRPHHEILEELVSGVRGLDSRFREVEGTIMEHGPRFRRGRLRHFHPMMMEEMAHMISEDGDDPISLLMLAGILRDDFPWLAEVITEAYREIRDGDLKSSQKAIERLRRFFKSASRREFMMEFGGPSKDAHMMAMEMPRMLDHFMHRFEMRRLKGPDSDDGDPPISNESAKS